MIRIFIKINIDNATDKKDNQLNSFFNVFFLYLKKKTKKHD